MWEFKVLTEDELGIKKWIVIPPMIKKIVWDL
jgi:hypothetical protein